MRISIRMIPDRFIVRSGTCQLQDSTAFTCRVHCNDMAMTMISALAAIFDAILSWTRHLSSSSVTILSSFAASCHHSATTRSRRLSRLDGDEVGDRFVFSSMEQPTSVPGAKYMIYNDIMQMIHSFIPNKLSWIQRKHQIHDPTKTYCSIPNILGYMGGS